MSKKGLGRISFMLLLTLIIAVMPISCKEKNTKNRENGLYAQISTPRGSIVMRLFPEKAPLTVTNFVGLAEGTLDFANKKGAFYNGLKFHRVIDDFMIQGGDPEGSGSGGPGYRFPDEVNNGLIFDKPGILAMANAGPNTNGSQFFITHVPTDWLNGKHTIFGEVIEGQDVVDNVQQGDTIDSIEILRIGSKAKSYKANSSIFKKLEESIVDEAKLAQEESDKQIISEILKNWPDAVKDEESGIYSVIHTTGSGTSPSSGTQVTVHYTGSFMDGTKFDSSRDRDAPFQFNVGLGQVIPGWDYMLQKMQKGERRTIILPPEMAYGERGIGPIPPNSWLVFDVELLDF